jgi:hypothetical protein
VRRIWGTLKEQTRRLGVATLEESKYFVLTARTVNSLGNRHKAVWGFGQIVEGGIYLGVRLSIYKISGRFSHVPFSIFFLKSFIAQVARQPPI